MRVLVSGAKERLKKFNLNLLFHKNAITPVLTSLFC